MIYLKRVSNLKKNFFLIKIEDVNLDDGYIICGGNKTRVVPMGTIFVSFKLTVGRVAIATTDMCTNEAISHFYIEDEKVRSYVYCYLKNFEYDTLGNTSSISKAVNSKIIKAMPFVIPTEKIVLAFSEQVEPIMNAIKNKQEIIIKLTEARERLLPKLMSGEIEV